MKITARRVRDGRGLRPLVQDYFHDELGTVSLRGAGEDVWIVLDLAQFFSSTLQELATQDRFHRLVNRLVTVNKYPPETKVLAATKAGARIIEIKGRQFLEVGYTVHQRDI